MKHLRLFFLFGITFLSIKCSAQPFFEWNDSIQVKVGGTTLANPWAGGLNFIQASNIDMNGDGIKDLFMFDRTGNKIRTYINRGTAGSVDFKYDPYYETKFPKLREWALLADYNNDGKEDIFSYSNFGGGFDVYKNTTTATSGLQFQLVSTLQRSDFNPVVKTNSVSQTIPDAGVISSWDGVSGVPWTGSVGNYTKSTINIPTSTLNGANWDVKNVNLTINHPNDDDLIVYLVNPCGNKMRLIKNAGGTGDNFTNTSFSHYYSVTGVIGSVGYNTAPFTSTYVPEAGAAAWSAFVACTTPNGIWSLNIGDQTAGSSGVLVNWGISFYSSGPNLYVSSVDIPAISDIDNDGDLDVVTFAITGTYMEYHKNLSMEYYGTGDSLRFQMANRSWGYAAENALSNDYTLFDSLPPGSNVPFPELRPETTTENKSAKLHSGSCQLCIDLDNDGDKEFIVGDISFNNLTMLTNGGTITDASFVAKDIAFPSNNTSTAEVDMTIFPCAYYADVNDDGVKDLIVSPNAPNISENFNSVEYYKNTGTNTFPIFNFQQSNLLQDNMIEVGEGAYPAFFDYDHDGLKDLFIGNYGYFGTSGFVHEIALFKNIGTATDPKFDLVTRDYANLSAILTGPGIDNFVPAFGDMDGDGDADMIIGLGNGTLQYFENTAAAGATANFVLTSPNLKNSLGRTIDVGDFAAPQIVDMDNNGINDLVIGGKSGKLAYYRHTGVSAIPVMDSITHFFGNVKVNIPGYPGYSYPFVYKQGGVTNMFVGEESGFIRHYNNIDGNLGGTFTWVDSIFGGISQGTRTAPNCADIDNDGYLDLIVGNYEGGVSYYKGVSTLTTSNNIDNLIHFNFDLFPNPANNTFTIRILNSENRSYAFELYNVMGQLITKEKIINNSIVFDTQTLKQGIYICKVSEVDGNGVKTTGSLMKKIIVQH